MPHQGGCSAAEGGGRKKRLSTGEKGGEDVRLRTGEIKAYGLGYFPVGGENTSSGEEEKKVPVS